MDLPVGEPIAGKQTGKSWQNTESILKTHYPKQSELIVKTVLDKNNSYWTELRHTLFDIVDSRKLSLNIHM